MAGLVTAAGRRRLGMAFALLALALAACTRFGFNPAASDGGALLGDAAHDARPSLATGHPRLYFSEVDVPTILAKVTRAPYQSAWLGARQYADAATCPQALSDYASMEAAATALRHFAFVYALSKDRAYGDKAKQCLLAAAAWPKWRADGSVRPISWETGLLHAAIAECYDWVYPLLSAAERQQVLDAMVSKALAVAESFSQDPLDEATHKGSADGAVSWSGVGLIVLAALGDDPRIASYYQLPRNRVKQWFLDLCDSEGGWGQSLGAMGWGLATGLSGGALWYAEALKRISGEDLYLHPKFVKAYQFPLYLLPPDYKNSMDAFGDDGWGGLFHRGAIAAFASRQQSPYAQWYYHHAPISDEGPGLQTLFFYDDALPEKDPATLPTAKHFPDIGWVAMRTSFAQNGTLVGFKHTPTRWTGERADHNSFFFDALGERLVVNSSVSSRGYEDPSYFTYYAAAVSANTVLIDGDPDSQYVYPDNPAISYGKILSTSSNPSHDYVRSEAAPAYKGKLSKFERQLVFAKPDKVGYVVLRDTITSSSGNHRYDFLVHGLGSSSITTVPSSGATLARNQARLAIRVLSPSSPSLAVQPGQPIEFEGEDQPTSYLQISTTGTAASAEFLVVLFPYPSTSSAPTISFTGTGGVGAVVARAGTSSPDTILFKSDGTVQVSLGK